MSEDVGISIVLANRGKVPMVVNRRLLIAPVATPKPFREVTFEVHGPPGYVNRNVAQVNSGRPRPEDFAELAPGATVEKSFDLTRRTACTSPASTQPGSAASVGGFRPVNGQE